MFSPGCYYRDPSALVAVSSLHVLYSMATAILVSLCQFLATPTNFNMHINAKKIDGHNITEPAIQCQFHHSLCHFNVSTIILTATTQVQLGVYTSCKQRFTIDPIV